MTSPIRGHLAFHTLALALGFSALAAGGIHLPVLVTYAVLVVASGLLVRIFPPRPATQLDFSSIGVAAVALALGLVCLLQALPVPLDWLSSLAPKNADIWERALRPFQQPAPTSATLSLAPGRSLQEALQLATYAVVFLVSARLSRSSGPQPLCWLAFGCALAVAAVTAAHQLLGAERLYGTYRPLAAYNVAPLLNPNNRAGYLNLGLFCGLGLLYRSGSRPYLGLVVLGLCFVAAEVLLCRSLGGTTTLAMGWGMLLLLTLHRRAKRAEGRIALSRLAQAGILGAIGAGAVLLALAGKGSAPLGLDARALEKVELWRRTTQLVSDFRWFGVGRGAFGSVYPEYQGPENNIVFEHVENFPLQWAAEWGIPVTLAALLGLALSLRAVVSRRTLRSPTRRCALIGCAVLLLQNLADLGLELPAVAALLSTVLGALSGAAAKDSDELNDELAPVAHPPRQRVLQTSCSVALACLVLTIGFGAESLPRARRDLYAQLENSQASQQGFWSSLERAVRAYPAEPYFPLLGSSAALAAGSNALPWIARALERNPRHAPSHLQLARILYARGSTAQAFGAIRRALELDPSALYAVLALERAWNLSAAAFEAAAPIGRAGVPLLLLLAERTADSTQRRHLLEEALARAPDSADAHYRLALDLLTELARGGNGDCADLRERCLTELSRHIQQADAPGNSRAVVLRGHELAARGENGRAEQYLEDGCKPFPGDVKCLEAWVARALSNRSPRLQQAVNAYVAAGCTNADRCAQAHRDLGTLLANSGRWHMALGHFQHAAREASTSEAWQAVARAAEQVGDETTARDARRRISLFARDQLPAPEPSSLTPSPPETAAPGRGP